MSETALNFGPEWVRALSHGGSVSSPPSSPGPIKFKLADYRYGREEMLALFSKDFQPPDGLENLGSLCIEQTQEPLAFLPMNIEEQRLWQRCVNSEAVLRSVGRVPPNGIGRGRGGSVDRGRGRGRGGAPNYYGRGVGYDDDAEYRVMAREGGPPGMSSRTKGYERSQSMTDTRNWPPSERSAVAPEERVNAVSSLKGRSSTGNWRARGENEEESDRWRGLSHSRSETKWGGNRGVWRDGEWDESRGHAPSGSRSSRPPWESEREREGGYRRHWEDDNLPEWAIDSPEEKGGTFDATGAFHAPGSSDEDDQEEANGDLGPPSSSSRNGPENGLGEEVNCNPGTNGQANEMECEDMKNEGKGIGKSSVEKKSPLNIDPNPSSLSSSVPLLNGVVMCENTNSLPVTQSNHDSEFKKPQNHLLRSSSPSKPQTQVSVSPMLHYIRPEDKAFPSEEDKLLHMQSVADDLVAKLVEDVEESTPLPEQSQVQQPPAGFIAASNATSSQLPEDQWYYTDPQGDIQGPFAAVDMAAWYKAGYFKPNLLLRRQCDDKFAQLGDLTRAFGRVPFLPGPAVPPLKVSELLNAQKVEAERQRYEMMQAQLLQKQLYQQQNTLRQQQVLQSLQNMEEWRTFTPAQQQQLFMHHIMSLPPLPPPALPNAKGLTTPSLGVNNPPLSSLPGVQEVVLPSATLPLKQDPIQAFVAQMSAAGSSGHVMMPDTVVPTHSQTPAAPPSSSAPLGGGDGPLQKLLLQLQRGPQPPSGETVPVPPTSHQAPPVGLSLEKAPDQQMDAIQSIMNQLSKIQGSSTTGEVEKQDDQRQRELEQKRIEEERRKFEEQRKAEELRLQKERLKDEKVRKELELENEKLVEELKRIQADQAKKRKQDETTKKKDASKVPSGEANRKEEEQRRQQLRQKQQEEEKKKQMEEERRKKEEARKAKDEEKKREEQRIKAEEEQKRKEKEREREKQLKIQEEMRKTALEDERRRMQQLEKEERKRMKQEEQAKKKANSGQTNGKSSNAQTPWATSQVQQEKVGAPSLIEIQKAQEIKSKKEKEAEAQREVQRHQEAQRIAAEEKKQKEMSSWVNLCSGSSSNTKKRSQGGSNTPQIKSLVEIQKEEARELKQRLEKEQAERAAAVSHLSLNAAGVWGAAAQSLSWANRASSSTISNAPPSAQVPNSAPHGTSWNNGPGGQWSAVAQPSETSSTLNSGGFWDSPDLPKTVGKASSGARSPHKGGTPPSTATASLPSNPQQAVNSNSFNNNSSNKSKKTKEDTGANRGPSSANAEFRLWCKMSLSSIRATASIDVPTFIGFLSDVESPYEVHDYIRSYLGDSKEVKEFARQYLERRSRARNALKEARMDDNILAPAPAVNPSASGASLEFQEVKTRLKKGKKKMQKVDNSILGFSLNSVERSADNEQ